MNTFRERPSLFPVSHAGNKVILFNEVSSIQENEPVLTMLIFKKRNLFRDVVGSSIIEINFCFCMQSRMDKKVT